MLSRFSQPLSQAFARSMLVKFQSTSAKATPQPPAESGKRDLVNFPRRTMREYPPKVRFALLPDSWFEFFYPKTGVTGPYMLLFGGGTYLFSKEIIVIDHYFVNGLSVIFAFAIIQYKFGDKIAAAYNKMIENNQKEIDGPQEEEKEAFRNAIKETERSLSFKGIGTEVQKAKMENIQLQMESAYRDRLAESHKMVKNRMDCLIELDNVTRRITQKNLMDYVLKNVMQSITPELENSAMQSCIANLNTLSSRA